MFKDCDSQANLPQDDKLSPPDVAELPCEVPIAPPQKGEPIQNTGFIAEVRKRSPYNFVLAARDHFHYLNCDVPLILEENKKSKLAFASVIAEFPAICNEALVDFIDDDEDLLGMILIQFHMQVLRNLLLFCLSYKARTLILYVGKHQVRELGIYEDFIKRVDEVSLKNGIAVRLEIPAYTTVLDQCNDLIDGIVSKFRKMLWEEKTDNPAMWNYLASNRHFSIVGL